MTDINIVKHGAVISVRVGAEQFSVFVTSDVHFDSPYCNREQLFKDLKWAADNDLMVVVVGDFFDAMQGRYDKRRDMSKVRPEYRSEDYYDSLVDDAYRKLLPFKDYILMLADGNHELSVLKHANTHLLSRLVEKLRESGSRVEHAGYGGWLRWVLEPVSGRVSAFRWKYFHGSGGEAPVTRGVIQTNRQAVFLPDADVVLNGHSHNTYWLPITRERVSRKGVQYFDIQHHVRTPGYMQGYGDGTQGWEVTRGGVPKPIGSAVVTMNYTHQEVGKRGNTIEVRPVISNPVPVSPIMGLFEGTVFPQE